MEIYDDLSPKMRAALKKFGVYPEQVMQLLMMGHQEDEIIKILEREQRQDELKYK